MKEALGKGVAKSRTTTGLPDFETRASPNWVGEDRQLTVEPHSYFRDVVKLEK